MSKSLWRRWAGHGHAEDAADSPERATVVENEAFTVSAENGDSVNNSEIWFAPLPSPALRTLTIAANTPIGTTVIVRNQSQSNVLIDALLATVVVVGELVDLPLVGAVVPAGAWVVVRVAQSLALAQIGACRVVS